MDCFPRSKLWLLLVKNSINGKLLKAIKSLSGSGIRMGVELWMNCLIESYSISLLLNMDEIIKTSWWRLLRTLERPLVEAKLNYVMHFVGNKCNRGLLERASVW